MSSKPPIGYIDIRVFAHATEDPEKVLVAIHNLLPSEHSDSFIFREIKLTGHHGNPIILFKGKITAKEVLPGVLKKIGSGLTSLDKEQLNDNLKLHLEKSNLYLRFDKQFAFTGEIRFSRNDPIHFKIHFKNKNSKEIIALCRDVGLLP